MLSDCTAGSHDLNLWFDTDGIILTVTQCELMWEWMFLHLVCDSNFLSVGYQGRSACRWAASPNPGCLSGPNLRKSLWHSNPAKTWHTHTHTLKTVWKLTVPVHSDGTHFSDMRVANAASLALMLQESAEPSLLFLRARIAMILQILRTGRHQEIKGLF